MLVIAVVVALVVVVVVVVVTIFIVSSLSIDRNKMKVRSLKKTDLQVELSVRDPYSGRLLTKARHNHNAMLVLQLNSTDEGNSRHILSNFLETFSPRN